MLWITKYKQRPLKYHHISVLILLCSLISVMESLVGFFPPKYILS